MHQRSAPEVGPQKHDFLPPFRLPPLFDRELVRPCRLRKRDGPSFSTFCNCKRGVSSQSKTKVLIYFNPGWRSSGYRSATMKWEPLPPPRFSSEVASQRRGCFRNCRDCPAIYSFADYS